MSIFELRSDAGHGWLIVTPQQLLAVGLSADDISPYSYQDAKTGRLALEEDLDASTFFSAFVIKHRAKPEVFERQNGGEIRSWRGFGKRPSTQAANDKSKALLDEARAILRAEVSQ